jgi:hypothetical protein
MTMMVVRDKSEFYDMVWQARQTSRQQRQVRVSVRAPDLDEQVRGNLQSEIQAVLDQRLRRAASVRVRADSGAPSDEQVRRMIRRELRLALPPASPQRPSGQQGVRVTMGGLQLSARDRRALESEVRQLVLKRLGGARSARSRQQIVVCGCAPFGWGCCDPPGALIDLSQIDPLPGIPDPYTPMLIAVYMPPGNRTEDVWLMSIWASNDPRRDPLDPGLPPDQMLVGLRIDSYIEAGMWAKEIQGWTTCQCVVQTIHQDGATVAYQWMLIDKSTVDTLVFRKAQVLGLWDNAYNFDSLEFWKLLGGLIVTFDWVYDGGFG